MKALRFYGSNDLRVEDIAAPEICGPRQVIVKVAWCGICGTDLHEYAMGPIFMPSQQILGHEFSGTVVEGLLGLLRCFRPFSRCVGSL